MTSYRLNSRIRGKKGGKKVGQKEKRGFEKSRRRCIKKHLIGEGGRATSRHARQKARRPSTRQPDQEKATTSPKQYRGPEPDAKGRGLTELGHSQYRNPMKSLQGGPSLKNPLLSKKKCAKGCDTQAAGKGEKALRRKSAKDTRTT